MQIELTLLAGSYAVCRLSPKANIPPWAADSASLSSVTRTPEELSIVCEEDFVPDEVKAERGWRCFRVSGPLDFQLIGILAALTRSLAEAEISVFALSTYDTDYLLVRGEKVEAAVAALTASGHSVKRE